MFGDDNLEVSDLLKYWNRFQNASDALIESLGASCLSEEERQTCFVDTDETGEQYILWKILIDLSFCPQKYLK